MKRVLWRWIIRCDKTVGLVLWTLARNALIIGKSLTTESCAAGCSPDSVRIPCGGAGDGVANHCVWT